jgi:hypothetical protein
MGNRRARSGLQPSLGHARQALSESRAPCHRRILPARSRRCTRPRARPLAQTTLAPNRRRRARLARRAEPGPRTALPRLPRSAPHARTAPPPQSRTERRGAKRPRKPGPRRTHQGQHLQRRPRTGAGTPLPRDTQDAPCARRPRPARGHIDERERVARGITRARVPHDRVPPRTGVRQRLRSPRHRRRVPTPAPPRLYSHLSALFHNSKQSYPLAPSPSPSQVLTCSPPNRKRSRVASAPSASCAPSPCASSPPQAKTPSRHAAHA